MLELITSVVVIEIDTLDSSFVSSDLSSEALSVVVSLNPHDDAVSTYESSF